MFVDFVQGNRIIPGFQNGGAKWTASIHRGKRWKNKPQAAKLQKEDVLPDIPGFPWRLPEHKPWPYAQTSTQFARLFLKTGAPPMRSWQV